MKREMYLDGEMPIETQRVFEQVAYARAVLEREPNDPGFALEFVKHLPELEMYGLADLAWMLASGEYGCSYNDVVGLLDDIDRAARK